MAQKLINQNIGSAESILNQVQMDVSINNVIYTAVTDRDYSLSATVPTQIAENGFEYSDHAIIQPMSFDFTIIVSKIDLTEYNTLRDLFLNKTIFAVESLPFTRTQCIIKDFRVSDDMFDSLTLKISVAEILFSYLYTISSTDTRLQLFDSTTTTNTASANAAISTDTVLSPGNVNESTVNSQLSDTETTVSNLSTNIFTGNLLNPLVVTCPPIGAAIAAAGVGFQVVNNIWDKITTSNNINEDYDNMRAEQFAAVITNDQ